MRLATALFGFGLLVLIFLQSSAVGGLALLEGHLGLVDASIAGLTCCFFLFCASALVFGFPRISMHLYILAGSIGYVSGLATPYRDMLIWGGLIFFLAAMSHRAERAESPSLETLQLQLLGELERLGKLRASNALSEFEFTAEKKKILARF